MGLAVFVSGVDKEVEISITKINISCYLAGTKLRQQ